MDTTTPGFGVRFGKRSGTYVVVHGKARERIKIGKVGEIALADARTQANKLLATFGAEARRLVSKTFTEAHYEFIAKHHAEKSERTRYQVQRP